MHDEIIAFLRENPQGVSSQTIAERFLKFKNADQRLAHLAVAGILGHDLRCAFNQNSLWHAVKTEVPAESKVLNWIAVHLLMDPDKTRRRILHISIWTPHLQPVLLFSSWLVDPQSLPFDERESLTGSAEGPFEFTAETVVPQIVSTMHQKLPIFLLSSHYGLLCGACAMTGRTIADDYLSMAGLLRAAEFPLPRPLTLEGLEGALGVPAQGGGSVDKQGYRLAYCAGLLVDSLKERGIETRADIDRTEEAIVRPQFQGKNISYDQILDLPEKPGIYAFKNCSDQYLYIGKAKSLKRRLLNYFRESDESPEKLGRIRTESHSLIIHLCGSELESILLEYRLIRKHSPILNKQIDINERKGTYTPVNDSIILLPHAEQAKVMSFWFRRNQKIMMKPFDLSFPHKEEILSELDDFFFSEKLKAEQSDFPEQEIVFRWVRNHQDTLVIVPASRLANASQIFDVLTDYSRELSQ